ncbi:hypothetical protein ABH920_005568 [Catenulispora sp. EB89]|uniref:hypothetical protein n=1 Tax=Catenulispora sp. EB89 TaxID=3156257 RepID=UPI0035190BAB
MTTTRRSATETSARAEPAATAERSSASPASSRSVKLSARDVEVAAPSRIVFGPPLKTEDAMPEAYLQRSQRSQGA